jgi:NAD(P)-dependent dehydrogenase (short-subunit alcohol dehydrogenase family)
MAPADTAARVLVTGASQGIGKAILLALARSGHPVLGVSRTQPEEPADSAQPPESDSLAWRRMDLSNAIEVEECASSLESIPIRAVVLCAVDYGANQRHPVSTTFAQEWQRVIATNCIGHCVLVSRLLPKLITNCPGVIVNLSSDVAVLPATGRAAYAASKAGLHAMLRAAAAENPVESLRVYQLIPTFQLITPGLRRRRAAGFDFSTYVDPGLIAQVVERIIFPPGSPLAPGSYLVRRDGAMEPHPEVTSL